MTQMFDALWRAVLYCLHPRVVLLSLLPIAVAGGLSSVLAYFYWEPATLAVRAFIEQAALLGPVMAWIDQVTGGMFRTVIGPLVVVALGVPLLLILSLLLVSAFMTSAVVSLVARRRFPGLQRLRGGSWWGSMFGSLGATLLALLVLIITLPLWLLPPVALLLPPLIWGWLSYRVMSYDALAEHASAEERRQILRQHRWPLLAMGVVTGYFGMAPSLVWATAGALSLPFMPLLLPVFTWLYTLVFAFAALWFTHYLLAVLAQRRGVPAMPDAPMTTTSGGDAPGSPDAAISPATPLPPLS